MYNNARSGTLNRNQGGAAQAGPYAARSRQTVGNPPADPSALGARSEQSKRASTQTPSANPRQRGGQASLTIFGIPGQGLATTVRRAIEGKASPTPTAPAAPRRRETRVKGALSPYASDGLEAFQPPPVPLVTATPNPALPCVRIKARKFQAFERLARREVRPVEDVLAEWLGSNASMIRLDEERYGRTSPVLTPAMKAAAVASDAREGFRTDDDEQFDFMRRCAGGEDVTLQLAIED